MQYLYFTPVDSDKGFFLLDEWSEIYLLNISSDGSTLLIKAREDSGDDWALYAINIEEDAELIELDDDVENVSNAVFSKNGKDVIYTAVTGDDSDDVEVRRVRANGKEDAERLYDEAVLVDIQWDRLTPFFSVKQ